MLGRRGNVAIMTALLAVPLLGVAGLAIDVGNAMSARARLDAAADSAVLLGTTTASNQYLAGAATPAAAGQAAALQRFNGQAGVLGNVGVSSVAATVTQNGTVFTASLTYRASYQTMLAKILGIGAIGLNGASASAQSVNPYVDISVLMDVSSSMTIAATTAAIAQMNALTAAWRPSGPVPSNVEVGVGCAFACHWSNTANDFWALANSKGVQLRLTVLSAAVGNLIANIAALDTGQAFRLGLYTFNQTFTQIYPMRTNIAGASAALSQIAPDINDCSNNCPETYFAGAMSSFGSIAGTSGNGQTRATSQKFLFIVSDGLVDQYTGNSRVITPIPTASCTALKKQGITILTLYTPYLPLTTNAFYNTYVWPYQNMAPPDQIQQAMTACATAPNLAFVASNASQIDTQLQVMLASVLQTSGHLTK